MILYEDKEFKIKRNSRDYVLIRKNMPYEYHSHFRRKSGADTVISLFYKNIKPNKKYFETAIRRVTTKEEFHNLRVKKRKLRYRNDTGYRKG